MNNLITISNNGPELLETNYWDLDHAKKGFLYLSWNAGAARLLVPDSMISQIDEMRTGKYVIVSRGKFQGREALELLFEDNSDSPYCVHLVTEQTDRLLPDTDQGSGFIVSVWTRSGKQLQLPGKYRVVDTLPHMQPWTEQ